MAKIYGISSSDDTDTHIDTLARFNIEDHITAPRRWHYQELIEWEVNLRALGWEMEVHIDSYHSLCHLKMALKW